MRRVVVLAVVGMLLLTVSAGLAAAQGTGASAELEDADGNPVGTAEFTEGLEGVVVTVNLQPGQDVAGPGEHGIHIHETGGVSPDFEAAGEHFNPTSAEHGLQNSNGPHAGDLEEITVNEDGSASYQTVTDRVTLTGGQDAPLDSDGSTLMIHAGSDDQETDPGGSTGGRVIADVIQASATGETTSEGTTAGGKQSLPTSGGINILTLAAFLGAAGLGIGLLLRRLASRG